MSVLLTNEVDEMTCSGIRKSANARMNVKGHSVETLTLFLFLFVPPF